MDHFCYLCLVFVMLSRLIAAFWSTEGKGLTSLLLFVMFLMILLLFHFGILGQVWYLIVSIPDPCCLSYFKSILKAKSYFTLLLYIPFLGIGEWYFKCV